MTIMRYVLADKEGHEQDYEYEHYGEAEDSALSLGYAVIERTYEYEDSALVWTPNGSTVWPPEDPEA